MTAGSHGAPEAPFAFDNTYARALEGFYVPWKAASVARPVCVQFNRALAEELGLTDPSVSDDAILDAMMEHPILIQRPLVETDKGVRLCRPQEEVHQLL